MSDVVSASLFLVKRQNSKNYVSRSYNTKYHNKVPLLRQGRYVTVYTDDTSIKYLIDPVTETVILVTPNGNVTLDETKEELFQNLKEKGYTEC